MPLILDVETVGATTAEQAEAVAEMAEARGLEPDAFAALCPPLARVVAICFLDLDSGRECQLVALEPEEEKGLLVKANAIIAKARQLVTFNGRCFDLAVLIHRSIINGVQPTSRLVDAAREYRYRPSAHYDLRDAFTFFGAVSGGTLRAFALGYGLEDPKAGGDGSDVARLVAEGKAEELATYCMRDVRTTAELYRRWRDAVGAIAS
jgi:predicted PolB exonuclease-like 3'-5' exonuclease